MISQKAPEKPPIDWTSDDWQMTKQYLSQSMGYYYFRLGGRVSEADANEYRGRIKMCQELLSLPSAPDKAPEEGQETP